ncbi:PilW family protein [Aquitalea sp. LB_tupeE]|uniref:PilW family protein n=1 Tax=Aquitalea sp. LB_tupeE TaxID=2748078 RepID=UPI0015BCFF55|nr:prepilin-type N-terminal cleavage/methylation domain-containing protein [Aquitalea sp. LB_tupeE]NWK78637.1 prepilin-type N-terminal cleavage/methylation domain-containing protein [Aquitalea sp. LB_tupeE]
MMQPPVHRYLQQGLTLIELMVAMTIGLLFLLALSALFLSFKQTSLQQGGVAQMQDDQRMAMTILSQVIQSAGYFPNPASATVSTALAADSTTVSGVSFTAGQVIYGVDSGVAATPDTLYVRYQSAQNDGVVNCQGGTNASATTATYINQLSASATTLQLTCGLNGATALGVVGGVNLSAATTCNRVGYVGISNVKFLYGLDPSGSGSVTRYASAGVVSNWSYVYAVKPVITQLYCFQQGVAPQSVTFSQTISLPNQQ